MYYEQAFNIQENKKEDILSKFLDSGPEILLPSQTKVTQSLSSLFLNYLLLLDDSFYTARLKEESSSQTILCNKKISASTILYFAIM